MSQILSTVAVVGIDIGKNSFHVVGLDEDGAIVLRQKWSRGQIEARLANAWRPVSERKPVWPCRVISALHPVASKSGLSHEVSDVRTGVQGKNNYSRDRRLPPWQIVVLVMAFYPAQDIAHIVRSRVAPGYLASAAGARSRR
jgi:hypothetical protein